MKILVTGAAGFIGSQTAERLLDRGDEVVGIDNRSKRAHLTRAGFRFIKLNLADSVGILDLFRREKFNRVVHLGAQAGVRYSLQSPLAYAESNIVGTTNILEGCRLNSIEHLVHASTGSVYGKHRRSRLTQVREQNIRERFGPPN